MPTNEASEKRWRWEEEEVEEMTESLAGIRSWEQQLRADGGGGEWAERQAQAGSWGGRVLFFFPWCD